MASEVRMAKLGKELGAGGRIWNRAGLVGRALGKITFSLIIITANTHAPHSTPVKVHPHKHTCIYICRGAHTHTHWKY